MSRRPSNQLPPGRMKPGLCAPPPDSKPLANGSGGNPLRSLATGFVMDRRTTLKGAAAVAALGISTGERAIADDGVSPAEPVVPAEYRFAIRTHINGQAYQLTIDARASLLDVLRETLALTGAKKGCDHGQCGACTVHVDGRRVASCLTFAAKADGRDVTTIEGVGNDGALHVMQQAFIDHDALQCGYCTPGQIMAAIACVNEGHANSPDEIREFMSGNICRCGAYPGIVEAITDAAAQMRRG